ncbi:MAG: hypothetical protein JOZ07_09525 [Solirubrobacterales bacterium]|nr:hypothetical protein [Solirubrobacterales bacterium]
MRGELETQPQRTPILRRGVAGLVLIAVAALAIHFVIGLIMTVFWLVVAAAAVVAVLWAINNVF